jgi:hypothetical protein
MLRDGLPRQFELKPGLRLRRAYGQCTWKRDGTPPTIMIRCTADSDRTRWRRIGAILGTLLHEIAHLRYRSHGPRFWAVHRRLVDRAAAAGVYDPMDRDPAERGSGDEKLAASAAWPIALAARQKRLERARARRVELQPRAQAQALTLQPEALAQGLLLQSEGAARPVTLDPRARARPVTLKPKTVDVAPTQPGLPFIWRTDGSPLSGPDSRFGRDPGAHRTERRR